MLFQVSSRRPECFCVRMDRISLSGSAGRLGGEGGGPLPHVMKLGTGPPTLAGIRERINPAP